MTRSRRAAIRQATRELITVTMTEDIPTARQQAAKLAADPYTASVAILALAEAAVVILAGAAAASHNTEEAVWQALAPTLAAHDSRPPG